MSVIYALVAKEPDIVLCEETSYQGNFSDLAVKLLAKSQGKPRVTFVKDGYKFHLLNTDGIICLVFSIDNYEENLAFEFLDTINKRFIDKYTKEEIDSATKDSMKDTFNPVLKEEISNYNNTYLRTYDFSKYYNIESFKPEPLYEREYFAEERAIRRRIRNRN